MNQQKIKRIIEFLLALIGLMLASPILLVVAILVKTKLGFISSTTCRIKW